MKSRETYRLTGLVQGVGFRPTLWRTANRLHLTGCVYNDAQGVTAVVEGDAEQLALFSETLRRDVTREAPLARIDGIERVRIEAPRGDTDFVITESRAGRARTLVTPDAATCPA